MICLDSLKYEFLMEIVFRFPSPRIQSSMPTDKPLRHQLTALLKGGQAHATFDDAVKAFPAKLRGIAPIR